MSIKHQLQEQLTTIVNDFGIKVDTVELSHPQIASQGDYSTNVAMVLSGNKDLRSKTKEWKSPRDLAQAIAERILNLKSEVLYLDRVEVAGPGFINFYLTQDYFLQELENLLKDNETSPNTSFSDKKIMIEFTDPNPFKEFHIGHLYSNTVGESIARILEANGAEVKRANYQGDVGLHVAKAVWGMIQKSKSKDEIVKKDVILNSIQDPKQIDEEMLKRVQHDKAELLQEIESKSVEEQAKWLGEAYALGAVAYEEDEASKEEIVEVNKIVYSSSEGVSRSREAGKVLDSALLHSNNNDIITLYKVGRQWSLDYFEKIYARLGTKFDYYYFESKAGPVGLALVKEFLTKGVFKESEGAIIFPGEEHGLHTRVFINSLGLPTYEAKELGLAQTKYNDYPFAISISITGNEINEYFKVLLKVLSLINPEIAEKTRHLSHGMVRLPEGKMSSRTGNVITGEWLLDEAKRRLQEAYPEMNEDTLEKVAVASIKWALLRCSIGKDITFSIEDSISFEGDSGPYVQYTYARTQSVLGKSERDSGQAGMTSFWGANATPESLNLEAEELHLLKLLVRFPEIVEAAGKQYSPNILTNYLFDLAQAFNLFYQKQRILDPGSVILSQAPISVISRNQENLPAGRQARNPDESKISHSVRDDNTRNFRLALTQATGNTLKQGLYLLGIKAPEKM